MTWMRPRERNGTRYLGMSPRGGIAGPPEPYYSETGAGCQCASPGLAAHIMVGSNMHPFAAAGSGLLLAVLWFDLMFDVQTRKYTSDLPPEVLASISAYYRRVTTEAYPMNRLVALVMVLTLAAICAEIVEGENPWWIGWGSIALAGSGFVPTMIRTVPNARRLGSGKDSAGAQWRLARAVCRDHLLSLARIIGVRVLQLSAP